MDKKISQASYSTNAFGTLLQVLEGEQETIEKPCLSTNFSMVNSMLLHFKHKFNKVAI